MACYILFYVSKLMCINFYIDTLAAESVIQVLLVKEVDSLLKDLLERNNKSHHQTLSRVEVKILYLLIEVISLRSEATSAAGAHAVESFILKALQVDRSYSEDASIIQPCATILKCLNGSLYGNFKPEIQVSSSIIQRMLDFVLEKAVPLTGTPHGKKKKTASLTALVEPLFKHLSIVFMDKRLGYRSLYKADEEHAVALLINHKMNCVTFIRTYCQFMRISHIPLSPMIEHRDGVAENFDINLLISCARSTDDAATRNHVFSLLSAVSKVIPDRILDHILDILTLIGESAVTQQAVGDTRSLVHLLRTLGESSSLASLLVLLFRSLASNQDTSEKFVIRNVTSHREYKFALRICEQYSCMVWLPSLVVMLQKIEMGAWDPQLVLQLLVAMQIIEIVDDTANTSKHSSLRLSAVSTIEVLVTVFPSSDSVFNTCLATVIKHIHSDDLAVSSGCFRTVGALIMCVGLGPVPDLQISWIMCSGEKVPILVCSILQIYLNGLVRHLTDEVVRSGPTRKKKAKLMDPETSKSQEDVALSVGKWHVRALVLSSLHKCFLFDAGNLEFLDSSNFQVLMQTRSEKVRTRILGLKIVKYLLDNLKEEFTVAIAETIPFLGELLEDVEPNVKSLAQEILRDMETATGEDLRQYL
ncbi:ARM repeat superfamily protein [Tanacetum coccineum]